MSGLLPLGFTAPFMLAALLALPVIWWLLRLIPPRPKQVAFPPARLLADIDRQEETPDKSPWWLTLLRLLLAASLILALAGPVWRPVSAPPAGDGPLWVLFDNGWASARSWELRRAAAERLLREAETNGRPVLLAATAEGADQPLQPDTASVALDRLRALEPRSWPTARGALTLSLRKAAAELPPAAVVWLSDGLGGDGSARFVADLGAIAGEAELTVLTGLAPPAVLFAARNDVDALTAQITRAAGDSAPITVRALDSKGLVLGESTLPAAAGSTADEQTVRFDLPVELRNDVARLEITGETSAAGVQLLDDRWQRRTVGLVSGTAAGAAQPLLSPLYYLDRALQPFSEIRRPRQADLAEALPELTGQGVSVLLLADVGRIPDQALPAVTRWIEQGGTLVRFAGPHLAGGTDQLVPVRLRAGDRSLGGSLSWQDPQALAPFPEGSPFFAMPVPTDVSVARQVLAEPGPDLGERTWALLADGTPLVTAAPLGRGSIVLFHVTADTAWSNLPLSGTFVEMLRRVVRLSAAATASDTATDGTGTTSADGAREGGLLPPLRVLDGFGRFGAPDAAALPLEPRGTVTASRRHPPGIYGATDAFRAINLFSDTAEIPPLDLAPLGANLRIESYPTTGPQDLRAPLFLLALLLLFADAIAMMVLRGDTGQARRRLSGGLGLALLLGPGLALSPALPRPALAQESSSDLFALDATLETRLAYVVTGIASRDEASRRGLFGLTRYLASRTALEPEAPIGIDIARDELAFFPLLYWPVSGEMALPSPEAMARIDTYMRNGGTILFDTADQLSAGLTGGGASPAGLQLRALLDGLDIPPLEPVPPDHVLTKAFYLLDAFPGRYAGGPLWVEAMEQSADGPAGRPVRGGDGVSPVLITGNDFAAAWAIDEAGSYLFPTVPQNPRQREFAYRAGVNIIMYAMTGNYKADQVHIPALLERLGQ
ncbi:DUF4159 domain-containing protein [Stappia indica]|uniref:DUF4159 domain-containing protein n=1 Tax=Stappia indica TaxID=538381 RepID=UPI001CD55705|nr:DUF4159 domain-containing protein [Stappia indica]MCA1299315.1 DUF4159 domain-containing protein [Stappia indica]